MASTQPAQSEPADTTKTASFGKVTIRSVVLSGIFVLMVMYTLYLAAPLFMPLTVAFLVSLMFAPVVRGLGKFKIPVPVSSAIILIVLIAIGVGAVIGLSAPASKWIQTAPHELRTIDNELSQLIEPIQEKVEDVKEAVKKAVPGEDKKSAAKSPETNRWNPVTWLLSGTWSFLYGLGVSTILLYFMLASGDSFLRKLLRLLPRFEDKRAAVKTVQDIQHGIAVYLGTVTIINVCLGALAAAALYAVGMPNPILFGVMVGLLNFTPYIGPLVSLAILLLVALLSFDDVTRILLAPGVVLVLNVLEGQFITPTLTGRQLSLSPFAVFLSITLWGWMWGIVGVLIAVPLLASAKIACEHIEGLHPFAEFLGY